MENLGNVIDKSVLRLDYDKLKGDHKNFVTSSWSLFLHCISYHKFVTALADLAYYKYFSCRLRLIFHFHSRHTK